MAWDFNNNQPIYVQIVERIKLMIISGELKASDKLSSVREFAEQAGVNPNTMQKALVQLENEGLIYTERTSGRFISDDKGLISNTKTTYAKDKIEETIELLLSVGYNKEELMELIKHKLG